MLEKEHVIQVVLAVYDPHGTYSRYAGVVMTSLFSKTQSKVNVTILHDTTLTDDNRCRFQRTAKRWNQSVSFVDVSEHISRITEKPDAMTAQLSRGTLFRLLIPDFFDFPKVIYLDCDVIVNLDILELWNIKPGNFSLAVVRNTPDPSIRTSSFHGKIRSWILPYVSENYFNAGVLLMNLQKIREKCNLAQDSFNFFKRYYYVAEWVDQDFLNVFFREDVLFLEERFNHMINGNEIDNDIDNAVLHFCAQKPWQIPQNIPSDRLFWRFFLESEWSDYFMEVIIELRQRKPISSYHTLDCVKLLLSRIPVYLHINMKTYVNLWKDCLIIVREIISRVTERIFKDSYR